MTRYSLSSSTVRQAVLDLVREGLLYRKAGLGTFVAEPRVHRELLSFYGFSEEMIAKGIDPVLAWCTPGGRRRRRGSSNLRVRGSRVYEVQRIRTADGSIVAVETVYFPERIGSLVEALDLRNVALTQLIEEQLGLSLRQAHQFVRAAAATTLISRTLEIRRGAPILYIERTLFSRTKARATCRSPRTARTDTTTAAGSSDVDWRPVETVAWSPVASRGPARIGGANTRAVDVREAQAVTGRAPVAVSSRAVRPEASQSIGIELRVVTAGAERLDIRGQVCIVVDVIRATTALIALFEAGCSAVVLRRSATMVGMDASSGRIRTLRRRRRCSGPRRLRLRAVPEDSGFAGPVRESGRSRDRQRHPAVAAAEQGDHGGSLRGAPKPYRGSSRGLRPGRSSTRGDHHRCAGRLQNTRVALEDLYCAGRMVAAIERQALIGGLEVGLDDSALAARRLADFGVKPMEVLLDSATGRRFAGIGRRDDVLACAEVDAASLVPRIVDEVGDAPFPVLMSHE